ncbi:MAG: hypothetical protein ACR2P3_13245 [Geminicoccaceae bacterium]
MPFDIALFSRSFSCLFCFVLLSIAGCASGESGDPALASAIKDHYAAHATEEQGACRSPKIDSILDRRLVKRSTDGDDVMMVRYSYFDRHADMDANWNRYAHAGQTCGGIAERRFVLSRGDLGYRVTDMSGEQSAH